MGAIKVVCALIIRENKLLITQNGPDSDHPLQWEFPGGKIKHGEKAEDSIIREIREELDVEVEILSRLNHVIYDYEIKKIQLIPYLCRIRSGQIKLKEHVGQKWIQFAELDETDFSGADEKLIEDKMNSGILKEYIGEKMHDS
jgi:8-oxo-dGTP diphosphatase